MNYNAANYPGSISSDGLQGGANCQQFAFELVRYNGFQISNFRSAELWADQKETLRINKPFAPGDILLFHSKPEAWGAHVAVFIGSGRAVHLAKHIGKPAFWHVSAFKEEDRYKHFIGAKRILTRIPKKKLDG